MNYISYSLFGKKERYWFPVPYVIIANRIIYPNFDIIFYVSKDATEHIGFQMLSLLSRMDTRIKVEVISSPYINTEPATWRMRPLWYDDADFVLCRDLDAAPTTFEVKASYYFINSRKYAIHGIRSYYTHSTPLMAGLCGFNVPLLRGMRMLVPSFEEYVNYGKAYNVNCPDWAWGSDQELLRKYFFQRRRCLASMKSTLDTPVGSAPKNIGGFRFQRAKKEKYDNVDLSFIEYPEVLSIGDSIHHDFIASPFTSITKDDLCKVLELDSNISMAVREIIRSNQRIKTLYGLEGYFNNVR